jgi:hypothetical protein
MTMSPLGEQPFPRSDRSARRWFPLRGDRMQQEAFVRLSPCEKVVLLDINYRLQEHLSLVHREWRYGPYVETDSKWARRLGMSLEAFRRARRKLGKMDWVVFTSGFRTRGGKLRRTEYHDACYASATKGFNPARCFVACGET